MRAHQLAEPIDKDFLDQLAVDWVLCHRFVCDETGGVDGLDYWNGNGGKHLCFDRFRGDGYRTFAIGDALNDVSMIRRADDGVLFRPSMETRRAGSRHRDDLPGSPGPH